MAFFDFFAGKKESRELEYVLDRNIKPLKGYIQGKEFEEALQALHNAILNIMKHLESNIQSDAYYLNEEEVKRVFSQTAGSWYADFVLTVISDIKSLGYRIDVETNLKVGAYAICELFNSISQHKKAPLYFKDFAKEHSII